MARSAPPATPHPWCGRSTATRLRRHSCYDAGPRALSVMARHLSFRYFFVADCVPIVNKGRNQTGNGPDRCPGHNPATRLRPLPVYSAARQRSAPKPRPESASPSSSQVRTPAFQAGNTGSNPVGDTIAPSGAMAAPAGFGRRASPAARSAGSNPVGDTVAFRGTPPGPRRELGHDAILGGAPRRRLGALGRTFL